MAADGFAVLDVETTGFSPSRGDRIVEIAIVHVTPDGEIEGAWETLLDPGRDVGPTRIHGIEARHVVGAPRMADIGPRLLNLLSNRVLVAHNMEFDGRFLAAEVSHVDDSLIIDGHSPLEFSTLCTMRLAAEFFPASARSLDACCTSAGIARGETHRASADATDTAKLLGHYLSQSHGNTFWDEKLLEPVPWLLDESSSATWYPREHATAPQRHFVERVALEAAPIHASGRNSTTWAFSIERCSTGIYPVMSRMSSSRSPRRSGCIVGRWSTCIAPTFTG